MIKPGAHRADPGRSVFRKRMHVLKVRARLRKCARELVDKYRPRKPSTSNKSALRATDRDIIADDGESERTLRICDSLLFLGETEKKDVARVAHHNCEGSFVIRDLFDGLSDLSDVRRSKDVAADRGGQKSFADKASVCAKFASGQSRDIACWRFDKAGPLERISPLTRRFMATSSSRNLHQQRLNSTVSVTYRLEQGSKQLSRALTIATRSFGTCLKQATRLTWSMLSAGLRRPRPTKPSTASLR
jgi:hypothetical protein